MRLIVCFIFSFLVASFLEYWVHRIMHLSPTFGAKITAHYSHHRSNSTKGFLGDFLDFGLGGLLMLPAFLISVPIGIMAVLGTLAFAAFASHAHQIQHYNPHKCFWMSVPIHYLHHQHNQWDCNFGLAVDWWDRLFGTYRPVVLKSSLVRNKVSKAKNKVAN